MNESAAVSAGNTVQELCRNFTDTSTRDQTTDFDPSGWPKVIKPEVLILVLSLFFMVGICLMKFAYDQKTDFLRRLNQLPAHELPKVVEEEYRKYINRFESPSDDTFLEGVSRFYIAKIHVDEANKTRTITIIEDLDICSHRVPKELCPIHWTSSRDQRNAAQRNATQEAEMTRLLGFSDRSEPNSMAWEGGHQRPAVWRPEHSETVEDRPPPYSSSSSSSTV